MGHYELPVHDGVVVTKFSSVLDIKVDAWVGHGEAVVGTEMWAVDWVGWLLLKVRIEARGFEGSEHFEFLPKSSVHRCGLGRERDLPWCQVK